MKQKARKSLLIVIIGFFVLLCSFFLVKIVDLRKIKEEKEKQMAMLPEYCFSDLFGGEGCLNNLDNLPTILMLFNPHCKSCEQEVSDICTEKNKFGDTQIIMITSAPYDSCYSFYTKYELYNLPRLQILRDTSDKFLYFAGVRGVPTTFVYGSDKRLLKKFEGEVKAETLLKYANARH